MTKLSEVELKIEDFGTLPSFLKAYADARRRTTSYWSVAVWARQLKLHSSSALTMALHGQRRLSPVLEDRLATYFELSEMERKYFHVLTTLDEAKRETHFSTMLQREIAALRAVLRNPEKEVMRFERGQMIALSGEVDPTQASALLENTDLEIFPVLGRGILTLTALQYGDTLLGPYREFSLGLLVRKKGTQFAGMGTSFFGGVVNHAGVCSYMTDRWTVPYQLGTIEFPLLSPAGARTIVRLDGPQLVEWEMGYAPISPPSFAHHDRIMAYTEILRDRLPHYLEMQASEYRRKFDPRIDHFRIDPDDPRGKTLQKLEFNPMSWTYYENLQGRSFILDDKLPATFS